MPQIRGYEMSQWFKMNEQPKGTRSTGGAKGAHGNGIRGIHGRLEGSGLFSKATTAHKGSNLGHTWKLTPPTWMCHYASRDEWSFHVCSDDSVSERYNGAFSLIHVEFQLWDNLLPSMKTKSTLIIYERLIIKEQDWLHMCSRTLKWIPGITSRKIPCIKSGFVLFFNLLKKAGSVPFDWPTKI